MTTRRMTKRRAVLLRSAVQRTGLALPLIALSAALSAAGTPEEVSRPQASGDLAAADWCWVGDNKSLTVYPIVKNVGPGPWASNREGTYVIGISVGPTDYEKRYALPKAPYFQLAAGASRRLEGLQVPYEVGPAYMFGKHWWHLVHPDDPNLANNEHPSLSGKFYATDFRIGGKLYRKHCSFRP